MHAQTSASRIAHIQARLLELEGGGLPTGKEEGTSAVRIESSSEDSAEAEAQAVKMVTGWKHAEAWDRVKVGQTAAMVESILGEPAKRLNSAFTDADQVYYYETPIHRWRSQLNGQVRLKDEKVVSIERPSFP